LVLFDHSALSNHSHLPQHFPNHYVLLIFVLLFVSLSCPDCERSARLLLQCFILDSIGTGGVEGVLLQNFWNSLITLESSSVGSIQRLIIMSNIKLHCKMENSHLRSDLILNREHIKLLTLNIFMRPPLITNNGNDYKDERLKLISSILDDFDIICF
jgi:hypothetical protein